VLPERSPHWFGDRSSARTCFQARVETTPRAHPPAENRRVRHPTTGSSSETTHGRGPPIAFRRGARLTGFLPSSRHHRRRPLPASRPRPATFRPQAFSASRRLTPPTGSTGLFHPVATSRVLHRSGASLPAQPCPSHRRAVPPCRCRRPRSPEQARAATRPAPRLRGLLPREAAWPAAGV